MVGADVLGHPRLPSNGAIEHPTECDTVDGSGMDAEPNDPAGILIHHDQNPVGPQGGRFAPEQILQRLSFMWPMKVNQDEPPESCPGR